MEALRGKSWSRVGDPSVVDTSAFLVVVKFVLTNE